MPRIALALSLFAATSCGPPRRPVESDHARAEVFFEEGFRFPGTGFRTRDSAHPRVAEVVADVSLLATMEPGGGWARLVPTEYIYCAREDDCRTLAHFRAGDLIHSTLRSPGSTRELIVRGPRDAAQVEVYDLRSGERVAQFAAGGWIYRLHNRPLTWLDENRILAHWGAGTNVAEAGLYDARGTALLTVSRDAITVSPDRDFLAAWSSTGPANLEVYDLRATSSEERAVTLPPAARGSFEIRTLNWEHGSLVLRVRTETPNSFGVVEVPLPTRRDHSAPPRK